MFEDQHQYKLYQLTFQILKKIISGAHLLLPPPQPIGQIEPTIWYEPQLTYLTAAAAVISGGILYSLHQVLVPVKPLHLLLLCG